MSSLIDEWHLFRCGDCEGPLSVEERVDVHWAKVFSLKTSMGGQRYPLMSKLIKALLCLPHGNANLERGFIENTSSKDEVL
ncbi:hypothetical protein HPB48_014392 [Haemaphysalis longicornis]|uniref:Uncharacterized protein n=1 Tax=Haemaphysalis longicornis TaxID=44386 RepID=A0A9J6GR11_HAELO|nr:hypothetical protein HPB48_014392 [Haemaphysalis longicornis]